jgi:membrane-associated phospholipid phosphatase
MQEISSMVAAQGAGRTALAGLAGGVVLAVVCIVFVDRPAATWVHDTFHGLWAFVALTHIVDPLLPGAAIGFLAIGLAMVGGRRPGPVLDTIFWACAAALLAVSIKDQAKFAFGRLWPETWVNANPSWIGSGAYGFFPFHGGAGWSSFPSGHMTLVTAPMAVLAGRLPAWRWVPWVPVGLVAIGLYGADYHFLGDIAAGTALGAACGCAVLAGARHGVPR